MTQVQSDFRPVPDPTVLTTEQLRRELSGLRELLEARLSGMDLATAHLERRLDELPVLRESLKDELRTLFTAQLALHTEKFNSIQTQFQERDVRVEQTARDTKVAVDAALQAQQAAVQQQNEAFSLSINKSEAGTNKAIDAISNLIQTAERTLNDKINDVKSRLDRGEGQKSGISSSLAFGIATFGLLMGIAGVVVALFKP